MTEPTDPELWQFYMTLPGATPTSQPDPIEIMRATLAKWGTPPAVAGEPVAWLSTDCIGERYLCFTKPKDSNPARPLVFGDTTSQPTQAQSGAVPPTPEQIESLLYKYGYDPDDEHMAEMLQAAVSLKRTPHAG